MRFPVLSTRHGAELPTAFIDNGFRLCAVAQLPDRSELPRRGTLPHSSRLPLLCRSGDDPEPTRYTNASTPMTYDPESVRDRSPRALLELLTVLVRSRFVELVLRQHCPDHVQIKRRAVVEDSYHAVG